VDDFVLSPVVADALICERINQLAVEITAAGRAISAQMHLPGDTAETYQIGGVSQALQAIIGEAHRSGMPDGAIFIALVTAIAQFANAQQLGPVHAVTQALGIQGAKAAYGARKSQAAGFPTRGNA
jgi:hypothetical protein